ncbi:hypothetical protein HDU97_000281 [Phlyctochytrium planicorne]|nr:hypothetical protein HDU97_000281 [Phlyctochytrium planicorne]
MDSPAYYFSTISCNIVSLREMDLLDFDPLTSSPQLGSQAKALDASKEKYGLPITDEEANTFSKLFKAANPSGLPSIPAQTTAEFLVKSGLPNATLSEIWRTAGVSPAGASPSDFFKILKLIALQQSNLPAKVHNLGMTTALPRFDGISTPSTGDVPSVSPATSKPSVKTENSILDADKVQRFKQAFDTDAARNLFMKSGLAADVLAKIWELIQATGLLKISTRQFFAAMYIIFRLKDGSLAQVPPTIPHPLWEAIDGVVGPAPAPIASTPQFQPTPVSDWAISKEEQASSGQFFDQLDVAKKGYLTGDDSASFFLKSNLDSKILANIWELSNIGEKGKLSKDEFIVAMHLIKSKLAGNSLPAILPTNLIPPRHRKQSSLNAGIPVSPVKEKDPFGLDSFPSLNGTSSLPTSKAIKQLIPSSVITEPIDKLSSPTLKSPTELKLSGLDLSRGSESLSLGNDDLRAKRAATEGELRSVIAKKQELTLKLTQSRATYEAEERILNENIAVLKEDAQLTQYSEFDAQKNEDVLKSVKRDRETLQAALRQEKAEIAEVNQQIQQVLSEIAVLDREIAQLNSEFQMTHSEMKRQNENVEIQRAEHSRIQAEYNVVSGDLGRDQLKLEDTKKRLAEVNNKIAVQNAMSEKEKERTKSLSESLLVASNASLSAGSNPDLALSPGGSTKSRPPAPPPPASRSAVSQSAGNLFFDVSEPLKKDATVSFTAEIPQTKVTSPNDFSFMDVGNSGKITVEDANGNTGSFAAPPNGVPKPPVPAVAALAATPYLRLDSFNSAASSNTNDTSSIHSTTRKTPRFMNLNMEEELSHAFDEPAALPKAKVVADKIADEVFDDVFETAKVDDDFDFDSSFSRPSKTAKKQDSVSNAFSADFDNVFSTSAPPPTIASNTAKNIDFDALFGGSSQPSQPVKAAPAVAPSFSFDDAFGNLPTVGNPTTVKLSNEDLDAVFGGSTTSGKPAATPSSAPFAGFDTDFSTFNFADAAAATTPAAEEEVTDEVRQLMNMGFSKEVSIKALENNGFDVVKASNFLIDGGN